MGYHADIHRRLTDVEETGGAFLSSLFLLSQGEELWKSSFVFVGQAHKSPHPSPRRTEPWSPPPLGFYFPATPTSWRVCACSLEAPFVLPFCIWGEGVSWILGGLAGSPITGIWAVALTGCPTPPLDASILGGASLRLLLTWLLSVLPSLFPSFLPSFLRVCLRDPGWQLLSLDPGFLAGIGASQKLFYRRCEARLGEKVDLEIPQRRQTVVRKGMPTVGLQRAVYLAVLEETQGSYKLLWSSI